MCPLTALSKKQINISRCRSRNMSTFPHSSRIVVIQMAGDNCKDQLAWVCPEGNASLCSYRTLSGPSLVAQHLGRGVFPLLRHPWDYPRIYARVTPPPSRSQQRCDGARSNGGPIIRRPRICSPVGSRSGPTAFSPLGSYTPMLIPSR